MPEKIFEKELSEKRNFVGKKSLEKNCQGEIFS